MGICSKHLLVVGGIVGDMTAKFVFKFIQHKRYQMGLLRPFSSILRHLLIPVPFLPVRQKSSHFQSISSYVNVLMKSSHALSSPSSPTQTNKTQHDHTPSILNHRLSFHRCGDVLPIHVHLRSSLEGEISERRGNNAHLFLLTQISSNRGHCASSSLSCQLGSCESLSVPRHIG
jgi:hypothetical protein